MERALFISHDTAIAQARLRAVNCGVSELDAIRFCAAFPVRKQGQIVGYEAWYPFNQAVAQHDNLFRSPVMEHEV